MSLGLMFVLLCALASVTVTEHTRRCPEGFLQHGSSCYWFSTIEGSFAEARSFCQFLGSYLVRISSKDEDDFIRSHAKKRKGYPGYWLGATDLTKEDEFMWEGGFPLNCSYENWKPQQPDNRNSRGNAEHCLMLQNSSGYKWNDLDCISEIKFICERKVSTCCCKN